MSRRALRFASLLLPLLSPLLTAAQPDNPTFPNFHTLQDQFGNAWQAPQDPQQLLFVYDMSGNKMLRKALEVTDHNCLSDGRLVYLADISGMPGLIARTIALPRMRKLDYPVWLDRDGESTAALRRQADGVALLTTGKDPELFSDSATLLVRLLEVCGKPAAAE